MKLLDDIMNQKPKLEIASLIDVVFLLLIYFMVTSALIKKEADLSFMLPAQVQNDEPTVLPVEVVLEVNPAGDILLEGIVFQQGSSMDGLVKELLTLKEAAEASQSQMIVNILPDDEALHRHIVVAMDVCAEAKVKNLSFSMSD